MRLFLGLCALAAQSGAAFAQTRTGSFADSLRLSRRQAIAEALTRNAQLEIAREQTAQARARRVTAIAIPDPQAATASISQRAAHVWRRAVEAGVARARHPLPRQVPAQQPHRVGGHSRERVELPAAAADGRAPGVGDVRLAARRAQAPRQSARGARCSRTTSSRRRRSASTPAPRRSSTSFRRRSRVAQAEQRSDRQRARHRERAGVAQSHARSRHRRADRADRFARRAAARCPTRRRSSRSALANRPELAILAEPAARRAARARAWPRSSGFPTSRSPSSATTRRPDRRSSRPASRLPLPVVLLAALAGDIAQAAALRARARRDVSRHARAGHAGRSLGVRQREHGDAPGRLHARRARARGARSLSRRVDQLHPRRIVGARSAHRAQRAASARRANSPTHSPPRTPRAPISIARSAHPSRPPEPATDDLAIPSLAVGLGASLLVACVARGVLDRQDRRRPADTAAVAPTRRRTSRSPPNSGSAFTSSPCSRSRSGRSSKRRATSRSTATSRRRCCRRSPVRRRASSATPGAVVTRGQPLAYVSSPDFATAVADYRKGADGLSQRQAHRRPRLRALQERRARAR